MKIKILLLLFIGSIFLFGCKKSDNRAIVPVTIKGTTRDGNYSFTITDQTGKQVLVKNNITTNQDFILDDVRDGDVLTVKFTFHRMCDLFVLSYGRTRSSYVYAIDGDLSSEMTYTASVKHQYIY